MPAPAGSRLGDAVAAIAGRGGGGRGRGWGAAVVGLSPWELAAAVTVGGLLAPTWPRMSINTSLPLVSDRPGHDAPRGRCSGRGVMQE